MHYLYTLVLVFLATYPFSTVPILLSSARTTTRAIVPLTAPSTRPAIRRAQPLFKRSFSYRLPQNECDMYHCTLGLFTAGVCMGGVTGSTLELIKSIPDKSDTEPLTLETATVALGRGFLKGTFYGVGAGVPLGCAAIIAHTIGKVGTTAWAGGTLTLAYQQNPEKFKRWLENNKHKKE